METLYPLRKFVAPEYVFGLGARKLVSRYAKNLSAKKIMIVTDSGIIQAGWTNEIKDILELDGFETIIYSDVSPNPRDFQVMAGAKVFEDNNCDAIVAIGGGSVMDCAKGIGIVFSNKQHIVEFEGVDKVTIPGPPLICIPTTAGTSADVSQFCIITDTKRMVKIAIVSKTMVPDIALIDTETTMTMPIELTVRTGLDALTHAIEAFVSTASSPSTDLHALEAIRLISTYIPKLYREPENFAFRDKMMLASLDAGLAFSNASLGAVHAMAHSLGGLKDMPHGLCNTILLDKIVKFNFPMASERYRKIAEVFGLKVGDKKGNNLGDYLASHIVELKQFLDTDKGLKEFGLKESEIEQLSINALNDACIFTNPRKPIKNEIEEIYGLAI